MMLVCPIMVAERIVHAHALILQAEFRLCNSHLL